MERIIQFGEGNFLRAFAEEYIQDNKSNNFELYVCQARCNTKVIDSLKSQNNSYDIVIRGNLNNELIDSRKTINCISNCIDIIGEQSHLIELFSSSDLRYVISNTTEAGIFFDKTEHEDEFPKISLAAKLAYLINIRFKNTNVPLVFLPTELIESNGIKLKECIIKYCKLFNYSKDVIDYVASCIFCNTLVDRIVTGHDIDDIDKCSVTCEPYKRLYIEKNGYIEKILSDSTIKFVDDLTEYRDIKVRILNGLHTFLTPISLLLGIKYVNQIFSNQYTLSFINTCSEQIVDTFENKIEANIFKDDVFDRYNNPFINHSFESIALNSLSKFSVRCLPTILKSENCNYMLFSLASLLFLYKDRAINGILINDDIESIKNYFDKQDYVKLSLTTESFNLNQFMIEKVITYFNLIDNLGIEKALEELFNE